MAAKPGATDRSRTAGPGGCPRADRLDLRWPDRRDAERCADRPADRGRGLRPGDTGSCRRSSAPRRPWSGSRRAFRGGRATVRALCRGRRSSKAKPSLHAMPRSPESPSPRARPSPVRSRAKSKHAARGWRATSAGPIRVRRRQAPVSRRNARPSPRICGRRVRKCLARQGPPRPRLSRERLSRRRGAAFMRSAHSSRRRRWPIAATPPRWPSRARSRRRRQIPS